jgi:tetratricopeptide (TPR) repeat protein
VEYSDAVKYCDKSDSVDLDNVVVAYNNLGIICRVHKEYDQAVLFYEKALKLVEGLNDDKKLADALYNVGVAYKNKGDKESIVKAEAHFTKALKIAEKANYNAVVASIYFQIGKIYGDMKDFDIAEMSYKNCLKYAKINQLEEFIEASYYGLGQIEKLRGNYLEAIPHFENALSIRYDKHVVFEVKRDLGETYLSLGRTKDAIKVWESALTIEYDPNDPDILDVYKNLSLAYQLGNDLDKALAYSEQYSTNLQGMLQSTEYIKGGYDQVLFKEVIAQYDEFQNQQTLREKIRVTYAPAGLAFIAIATIAFIVIVYQRRVNRRTTAEKIRSFQVD